VAEGEGFEPPVPFRVQRFSSTQAGSDRFGKFSTLFDFSTAYKSRLFHRSDPICGVLAIELLQFYYSQVRTPRLGERPKYPPSDLTLRTIQRKNLQGGIVGAVQARVVGEIAIFQQLRVGRGIKHRDISVLDPCIRCVFVQSTSRGMLPV